jgi:DNA (cytosine-5)-methyltransferase 1
MKVGSLFSGIGGLDLGLEQAGMETVWQVEYDDWAREKLAENFPHTEKFKDVREVGKHNLKPVDLICGGFPCQDISASNHKGKGLDGEKSGLWFEYKRILCELRPRFALIENVAKLTIFGLDRVLSDLAVGGYDAEWQIIRAETFGLPQVRERLFIIAYAASQRLEGRGDFSARCFKPFTAREVKRPHYQITSVLGNPSVQVPEHLRMDNGLSFELSEIKNAIKGYGNAVAPPVAKWLGERILEFDKANKNFFI